MATSQQSRSGKPSTRLNGKPMSLATAKKKWRLGMMLIHKLEWLEDNRLTLMYRDRLWSLVNVLDGIIRSLDKSPPITTPEPTEKDRERFLVEVQHYLKTL